MLNENQEQEVWRTCLYNGEIFEDYQVSSLGRVKSFKSKIPKLLKPFVRNKAKGYFCVCLFKDNKPHRCQLHRLVLCSFVDLPENFEQMQVNHRNEIKSDNRLVNLEWLTAKENINYGTHNERVAKANTNHKNLSKVVYQFDLRGNLIKSYPSTQEAARQTGFSQGNISACCRGKYKTAYGFIWRYTKNFQAS